MTYLLVKTCADGALAAELDPPAGCIEMADTVSGVNNPAIGQYTTEARTRIMHYRLSPATDADRYWLDALRRAAYRDLFFATWGEWDEARHIRHFSSSWDQGGIHIIESDGIRVGMLQLIEHADAVEVAEIQIHPAHQRKGLGKHLLKALQDNARRLGKHVSLRTGLKNLRAVALYERLGFMHVQQTDTHFLMLWKPDSPADHRQDAIEDADP
jgi:ribosomal protein S18 acetylase RimI-like enzyme